jgi:sulfonate transport system substrate-binding protein
MPNRRTVLAALAALLFGPPEGRAQGAQDATQEAAHDVVRIGWLRAPNDITLAKARGTLETTLAAHGASVEWAGPFAAAAPAFEALNAGSIDITAGSSTASITALASNVPMVVFGYQKMAATSEGIIVKQTSAIHTLQNLVGKTVAVNRGGTGEYLLMEALSRTGIDPAAVRRAYLGPSDAGPAFVQGAVDAWAIWDPFLSIALDKYGARVLADGAAVGSKNAIVLIASKAFAERKRALLRIVFEAFAAENAWALGHKTEAGVIWAREMNIPPSFAEVLGINNAVPIEAVTDHDIAEMAAVADWYVANGIVPRRPDIAAGVVKLAP